MKKIELKRKGTANGWELIHIVNGAVVAVEWYSAFANAINRAEYFKRMDWRYTIIVNR